MHEPLYRPILRSAFQIAWQEKRLWWIALLAGILLTGSVYDIIWRGLNALAPQASLSSILAQLWQVAAQSWPALSVSDTIFGAINVFLITGLFLILAFAVFAASVIAQGSLVYAIGHLKKGRKVLLKDALTVGARALWPVLVLNILALSVLWATRALIGMALSFVVLNTTSFAYLFYLLAFVVFVVISIAAVIIQLFALNAMILQGATLAQGIERGYHLMKRHWVITAETAAILFLISIGSWILVIAVNMLLSIPLFMLLITAVYLKSTILYWVTLYATIAAFILITLAVGGFVVALHYAAWTLMYRRLGEGGVLPKLHRLVRAFTHAHHVPGA